MAKSRDPSTVAKKWSTNLQNSTQAIIEGVNNVTTNPAAEAIKKQATMKARLVAAIDSGKWAKGLQAVSLSDWQQAMAGKGVQRISQGAIDAEPKMTTFLQKLLPYVAQLQAQIKQMPNATDADRKARMLANYDGMKNFRKN